MNDIQQQEFVSEANHQAGYNEALKWAANWLEYIAEYHDLEVVAEALRTQAGTIRAHKKPWGVKHDDQ